MSMNRRQESDVWGRKTVGLLLMSTAGVSWIGGTDEFRNPHWGFDFGRGNQSSGLYQCL